MLTIDNFKIIPGRKVAHIFCKEESFSIRNVSYCGCSSFDYTLSDVKNFLPPFNDTILCEQCEHRFVLKHFINEIPYSYKRYERLGREIWKVYRNLNVKRTKKGSTVNNFLELLSSSFK